MLGSDEKMQPGVVDFPNFAQGFCYASNATRWDFTRAVTQEWYLLAKTERSETRLLFTNISKHPI